MSLARLSSLCVAGILLSACAGETAMPAMISDSIDQMETNSRLASASCTAEAEGYAPSPLEIKAKPVQLGTSNDINTALPPSVKFRGGWHLTSPSADLGGLSGVALQASGDLLAVSDQGLFFEIGLTDGVPNGRGTSMAMLDAQGRLISGKADGDAEGLALSDGLAFVSFERNHRILAFNLERCGVAARGILFAALPERILKSKISANGGAESLNVDAQGRLQAGYETSVGDVAPVLTFNHKGIVELEPDQIPVAPNFKLVGADGDVHLTRYYDREQGNMNEIVLPELTVRLAPPLAVDNFEGLAQDVKPDGTRIIYIISDDNFSARQRTLLYKFEVSP